MRIGLGHTVMLVGALLLAGCTERTPEAENRDYLQQLMQARKAKDDIFRNSPGEPVPKELIDKLIPLSYFPPNPDYLVAAELKPATERQVIDMPTSTGEVRKEERVGVLNFSLQGQKLTLAAFHDAGSTDVSRLFVPFRDLTTGSETYQAGRYMDLDRTPTGLYTIDFNKAYHPYCYYNSKYDCPYPPAENRLPIAIRAGERLQASSQH